MAAMALMASSVPATAADQTWMLDVWGGTGTPDAGPYASVKVTENGTNDVNVLVTLQAPSIGFVDTGGHTPFAFNLNDAADSISVVTAGFGVGSAPPFPNPPFGDFTNGIVCTTPPCGPGGSFPNAGPLSFNIHDGDGINLSSFVTNTAGWRFSADLLIAGPNGNVTGAVANGTPAIPEPETYAMMLVGFGLLGWVARRRKQSLGNLAVA
jgi:hypothetical protein